MGGCSASTERNFLPVFDLVFDAKAEASDEDERKILELVNDALKDSKAHIDLLNNYSGCEETIRKALNDPSPKTEMAAWKAVCKAVEQLHGFYLFSLALESVWPKILDAICQDDPVASVQTHLALTEQLAHVFDFTFHFDQGKMVNPAIQNDFSYFRRVLTRMRNSDKDAVKDVKVDEEVANKMSFFFAYPTPMMKVLIDATTSFDKSAHHRLVGGLSLISNLCLKALSEPQNIDESKATLYLSAMTGCIILVDHLLDEGAFNNKSPIRIKSAVAALKNNTLQISTDSLVNSLRFTTLHLNDPQTMPAITKLLS